MTARGGYASDRERAWSTALGGALRAARQRRRMALDAIAAPLGVSITQLSLYERGGTPISAARLLLAACAVGEPIEDLIAAARRDFNQTGD